MPNAPASLGPYRLLRLLGKGGMARVFEGEHARTGARHAIKELLLDVGDVEALQRFRREAELAVSLNHPHIARTYTADLSPPQPFLALELLGETLADRLERGPLSSEEARAVLDQVAAGVGHAHQQGVIHRDLKPANILFSAEGAAKVTDFGIAVGARVERLTQTGELLGTPSYMAPEQIDDPHAVDARADVYALGAILHAALSGEAPFAGRTSLMSTLLAVRTETPPPLPAGVDPFLAAACRRALAKAPAQRFQSAEAFRAALHGPSESRGSAAVAMLAVVGLLLAASALAWSLTRPEAALPAPVPVASRSSALAPAPSPAMTPATPPTPRGLFRVRRTPAATVPAAEVLVAHMSDGTLATYEHGRVRVGSGPWVAVWEPTRIPRFLLALDATRFVVGHPGRWLHWSALPQVKTRGATAAQRRGDVLVLGAHQPSSRGEPRTDLRVLNAATGAFVSGAPVGRQELRTIAMGREGIVLVGAGTLRASLTGAGELSRWRLADGQLKLEQRLPVHFTPNCLEIGPDAKEGVVGSVQGQLLILRVAGLTLAGSLVGTQRHVSVLGRAHIDSVVAARYLGSERLITVGRAGPDETDHGHVKVWDLRTKTLLTVARLGVRPRHVSIHVGSGAASIAVGGQGKFEEWTYRD